MRVSRATHEITARIHQRNHVLDREHGADLVSCEDQQVLSLSGGDPGTKRVKNAGGDVVWEGAPHAIGTDLHARYLARASAEPSA